VIALDVILVLSLGSFIILEACVLKPEERKTPRPITNTVTVDKEVLHTVKAGEEKDPLIN